MATRGEVAIAVAMPTPDGELGWVRAAGLGSRWRLLFRRRLQLESETSWFLLLGVLDMVLTSVLLNTGHAREANPLARLFLSAAGVRGLIHYKCALLALVTLTGQVIALRRRPAARGVLQVGIAVQLLVVAYSVVLVLKVML